MSGDAVRPKRVAGTVLDMVRSLGLIVVIIGVGLLLFDTGLVHPSKSQKVQPVAYSDYVSAFGRVTHVAAVKPIGLPHGWYVNSANLTHHGSTATLYIGLVTPGHEYAALYESNATSISIGASQAGDHTIRRTIGKLSIVITGSASPAELAELADSLAR